MHEKRAVADYADTWALRGCKLCAEQTGDAEAHRSKAHRADQRIRPLRLAELQEPVVVDPDVADQDCVGGGERAVDLVRGALGIYRRRLVPEAGCDKRLPFAAIALD
jgi:hypothetical protein